jgi:PAS domain S-box-containing protein
MLTIANFFLEVVKTLKDLGVFAVRPGLYRRFFERSNALFLIANDKGNIVEINPAFAERLGFQRELLRGTKFMKHVHPADQERTMNEMNKIRAGADVDGFRNRYICADDTTLELEWLSTGNGIIYAVAREIKS